MKAAPKPEPRAKKAPRGLKRTPMKRGTSRLARSPMKRGTKRIRKHKARHDVAATGPRRHALALKQHGDGESARCASPWCGRRWLPVEHEDRRRRLQEAHVDNVGMGGSRHDQDSPINRESNRLMLCDPCHVRLAKVVLATRLELAAEWKAYFECPSGHGVNRTGGAR